jgi:hypothetical protein
VKTAQNDLTVLSKVEICVGGLVLGRLFVEEFLCYIDGVFAAG